MTGDFYMLRITALAGLAMTALGFSPAAAQQATLFTATYVEVGPLLTKVGSATLHTYRDGGRKDKGNQGLDVYQRMDRPNQFVVLGGWADQAAYDAHKANDPSK